jgi:hypothetical protein
MAWRIPSACCPRCGTELRAAGLETIPVDWVLADEDAATLWPRGRVDVPAGVTTCADCRGELRGLYEDYYRWERAIGLLFGSLLDSALAIVGRTANDDLLTAHLRAERVEARG